MMRFPIAFSALAFLGWGLVCGAGAYEHIALIPMWTANPPESLAALQPPYGLRADLWWQSIHPVVLLLLIAALISNWPHKPARNSIALIIGGYLAVLIATAIYFVPELLALTTDPSAPIAPSEWKARADRWELLSLLRLAVMFALTVFIARGFLHAGAAAKPREKV
jgi:hypothetical protein